MASVHTFYVYGKLSITAPAPKKAEVIQKGGTWVSRKHCLVVDEDDKGDGGLHLSKEVLCSLLVSLNNICTQAWQHWIYTNTERDAPRKKHAIWITLEEEEQEPTVCLVSSSKSTQLSYRVCLKCIFTVTGKKNLSSIVFTKLCDWKWVFLIKIKWFVVFGDLQYVNTVALTDIRISRWCSWMWSLGKIYWMAVIHCPQYLCWVRILCSSLVEVPVHPFDSNLFSGLQVNNQTWGQP